MKKILTKMRHSMGILSTLKDEEAGLFVPNRQVSWIVAGGLLLCFLFFMLGYFWGHRRALDRFVAKIEEESFADRINYALYTMNDRDMSEFEQEEDANGATPSSEELVQNGEDQEENGEEAEASEAPSQPEQAADEVKKEVVEPAEKTEPISQGNAQISQAHGQTTTTLFVAPLAGFGTLHAATEFIKRVQLVDPSSGVEKKTSKTSKGRAITWYQATTGEFEKREDLEKLVSVIQKKEHIKDIKIVEKRKG